MACGKFENKLQFLCFNLKRIEHFLFFCKDTLPQPWCQQGEAHSSSWCKGECSKKKKKKKRGSVNFDRIN